MESSKFPARCTKSIIDKFFALSPKCTSTRMQASQQVIHLNVNNSMAQDQNRQKRKSVMETKQTLSTEIVEYDSEKKTTPFKNFQTEIYAIKKAVAYKDMILKEKDKLIEDLNQINSSQRKSMLDLQLDNESISHKLQDEMKKRQESSERLANLGTLVEALKTNSDVLKNRLTKIEELEMEMNDFSSFYSKEVDELKNKFIHVNLVYEENCNHLRNQISVEYQHCEDAKENLTVETANYEEKISNLKEELDNKQAFIEDLNESIAELNKKIAEKTKENVELEAKNDAKLTAMNNTIDELTLQNSDTLEKMREIEGKKQLELNDMNIKLQNEKQSVLDLQEQLNDKEKQLAEDEVKFAENETRFSELAVQITELETRFEESADKISSFINEQNCLDCEITSFKQTRNDMESVIVKLKATINEKQQIIEEKEQTIENNKLELNECRANSAYAQETKLDLEKQIAQLIEENDKLVKCCENLENLCTGIKFDMKVQEQILTTTVNNLDDKIQKQKEDYTQLEKQMENEKTQRSLDMKTIEKFSAENKKLKDENNKIKEDNDKLKDVNNKIIEDNDKLKDENNKIIEENDKLEDENNKIKEEIKNLKEKLKVQVAEKETTKMKRNLPIRKAKRVLTKNISSHTIHRTRNATPNLNFKPSTTTICNIFTPTNDNTDDSNIITSQQNTPNRKRVTFSPIITSHAPDNKFKEMDSTTSPGRKKLCTSLAQSPKGTPTSNRKQTCYGTPVLRSFSGNKGTIEKRDKLDKDSRGRQWIDSDDVFNFPSD